MEKEPMAGGGEKKEHLYKILVIGELGTGKTSIIKRYVHQFFSQHYRATAKEGLVNNTAQMDEFCKEKGFIGWYETSAKENINIDEAARFLVTRILEKDRAMQLGDDDKDRDRVVLDKTTTQGRQERKINCC
nr:hypothetical protein BaRGS_027121 [Batillaria attramentaria]